MVRSQARSRGSAASPAQFLQSLGQQFLQLRDGPPFQQHVPVGARRLRLLLLRLGPVDQFRHRAVQPAFPGRGDLGIVGEGHLEVVPLRARVPGAPARCQVVVAVGLVADCSEPATTQYAVGHGGVLSLGSGLIQNGRPRLYLTESNERDGETIPVSPNRLRSVMSFTRQRSLPPKRGHRRSDMTRYRPVDEIHHPIGGMTQVTPSVWVQHRDEATRQSPPTNPDRFTSHPPVHHAGHPGSPATRSPPPRPPRPRPPAPAAPTRPRRTPSTTRSPPGSCRNSATPNRTTTSRRSNYPNWTPRTN